MERCSSDRILSSSSLIPSRVLARFSTCRSSSTNLSTQSLSARSSFSRSSTELPRSEAAFESQTPSVKLSEFCSSRPNSARFWKSLWQATSHRSSWVTTAPFTVRSCSSPVSIRFKSRSCAAFNLSETVREQMPPGRLARVCYRA